ncbi:MAG: SH3 domain-containing protein [Desulfamplus sp.]|nr:SH3 domain-containing protein [Desulfamplus sp.]
MQMILLSFIFITISPDMALCEERLSVKAKLANVRSSPKIDGEVLWKTEMYYPIIVLEKKDGWIKFKDFENDTGWILGTLVDKTPSVITLKDKCNVRKGPGQDQPLAFTVERGVPFKVLENKGEWVKVQHADGETGWIFKSLLW